MLWFCFALGRIAIEGFPVCRCRCRSKAQVSFALPHAVERARRVEDRSRGPPLLVSLHPRRSCGRLSAEQRPGAPPPPPVHRAIHRSGSDWTCPILACPRSTRCRATTVRCSVIGEKIRSCAYFFPPVAVARWQPGPVPHSDSHHPLFWIQQGPSLVLRVCSALALTLDTHCPHMPSPSPSHSPPYSPLALASAVLPWVFYLAKLAFTQRLI